MSTENTINASISKNPLSDCFKAFDSTTTENTDPLIKNLIVGLFMDLRDVVKVHYYVLCCTTKPPTMLEVICKANQAYRVSPWRKGF